MANPFDTAKRLLTQTEASNCNLNDRMDLYFIDYDLMPLYMEENYIAALLSQSRQHKHPEAVVASVADCFAFADVMSVKMRKDGFWGLLGDIGLYSSVVPSWQVMIIE